SLSRPEHLHAGQASQHGQSDPRAGHAGLPGHHLLSRTRPSHVSLVDEGRPPRKAMASLTWVMVTDAAGQVAEVLPVPHCASQGTIGGRTMPLHPDLQAALAMLQVVFCKWRYTACVSPQASVFTSGKPRVFSRYLHVENTTSGIHATDRVGAATPSRRRIQPRRGLWRKVKDMGGAGQRLPVPRSSAYPACRRDHW